MPPNSPSTPRRTAALPERATAAAAAIHVHVEPLPAVLTVEDALAARIPIHGEDNVFKDIHIANGDLALGFAEADEIVEGEYRCGHQEQLYIETNGMIA